MDRHENRAAWFVWTKGLKGPAPSIYYEALPSSHDGRRNMLSEPRPLLGEDRELPLAALAAKYPPPKGE